MTQTTEPLPPFLAERSRIGPEISITGKWVPTKPGRRFRKSAESKEMLAEWEDIHAGARADAGVLSTEINHAVGEDAVLVHHVFEDPDALAHYFSTTATATTAAPPSTAAPVTTTTAPPTAAIGAEPSTPEEQEAVDAIDRWLDLEDQAFAAGSTDAVIDELDALVLDGSVAVEGSLIVGGAVERTSRARIDRIWHPDEGVIGLDVCKIIETPAGEERTAHTITATAGATPFLRNETVYILGRDGIT
ncbi:MAG: hypothetical protein ACERLM_11855, partial [Acidimicrobiales bacterium]